MPLWDNVSKCQGLPWYLSDKESACNAGGVGLISGLGRSPGGGHGNPLLWRIPWTEEVSGLQSIVLQSQT